MEVSTMVYKFADTAFLLGKADMYFENVFGNITGRRIYWYLYIFNSMVQLENSIVQ